MKKINKFLSVILTIICAALLFACTSEGVVSGEIKLSDWDKFMDYSETDEKIEYTWFILDGDLFLEDKDPIYKKIEEKFNVKINIVGGGSDWKNALSNKINANEIPDLFFALPDSGTYSQYIDTKVIMPLDNLIERANATNLKALFNSNQYKYNTKIGGLNFFVPMLQECTGHALYVNKSWMAKWNESRQQDVDTVPTTLDDFTAMLKYFHDESSLARGTTYGLALSSNWDYVRSLMATFGSSIDWHVDENGNYKLAALTEEYKDLLEWMKRGVEEGYIYPEFDSNSDGDSMQQFAKKTCGACINNGDVKIEEVATEWIMASGSSSKTIDDLLVCINPPSNGTNVGKFWGTPGYWGGCSIGINAKEPMRLIKILDYIYSEEGGYLMNYGVEGEEFDFDSQGNVVIDERHYLNRYNSSAFYTPRMNEPEKPIGAHKYNIRGYFCKIVEGNVVFDFNEANYFNKDFARTVYENSKNKLVANPTFLLNDVTMIDANAKILDAAERFSISVIKGTKTYENAKAELEGIIAKYKYNELCEYFKKTSKEVYGK